MKMNEEPENDKLWDLLGKSPRTEASPFFVRKVMRAVQEEKSRPVVSLSAVWRWLIPTAAAAALLLGWTTFSSYNMSHTQEVAKFNEYFDSVADLDTLLASQDMSDWVASGN